MQLTLRRSAPVIRPGAIFPLSLAADSRTLQKADTTPFIVKGFASWYVISRSVTEYRAYIDDCVAKGFNAIELEIPGHDPGAHNAPFNGNGDAPFTKTLSGANWNGSLTYANINNDAPDFTQPNETFWSFIDTFFDYCASVGMQVYVFFCYVGYPTTAQGWRDEILANGTTKMQAYGVWVATRFKNRANLVYMFLGDDDFNDTQAKIDVQNAYITGVKSVGGQASSYYSSEPSGGLATDSVQFGSQMNLRWVYQYYNWSLITRQGYAKTTVMPTIFGEGTYDITTPTNALDAVPMRRYGYWYCLASIAGYMTSDTDIWYFNTGYASRLNSAYRQDLARLNAFIDSVATAWVRLVPDGLGSIGTLVTAGGGSMDDYTTYDYVAAAATPTGDMLLAYCGPGHTGTFTIDMTKLRGTVTARWFDPTTGTYTAIGTYANTGTRAFTPPANHSDGFGDWLLRLDA